MPNEVPWRFENFKIGSGNGLSVVRRQTMTWTNADLLLVAPLGTNVSEIGIENKNFSVNKMYFRCM